MEKSTGQIVAESLVIAGLLTVVSYFNGGVKYPFDESVHLPPVWIQLLRIYAVYFVSFFAAGFLIHKIEKRFSKRKKEK